MDGIIMKGRAVYIKIGWFARGTPPPPRPGPAATKHQSKRRAVFEDVSLSAFSSLCCEIDSLLGTIRVNVRSFYRMLAGSPPQWILTYPEDAAPRTGDGLFPGDVVEVVQVRSRYSTYTYRRNHLY